MRSYSILFLVFVYSVMHCFSQQTTSDNQQELKALKKKFYDNKKIGTDSAIIYMDRLSQKTNIPYKTFGFAGAIYLKTRDKYPLDFEAYRDSINKYLPQITENKNNYTLLFDIYILLGNTSKRRGQMKAALEYYLKAENYALITNDIERIVKIKGNIALIYQDIGQFNKALDKIKTTLKIAENNKDVLGSKYAGRKYKTLLNTSAIYNSIFKSDKTVLANADSSIHYLNRILNDKQLKLSKFRYGQVYSNLAITYTLKEEHKKARPYYDKSIDLFTEIKAQSYLYNSYYNSGINYWHLDSLAKSKSDFLNVLRIKKDSVLDPNYVNTHKYLSEIYVKEKNTDSASYYFAKHEKILERAFSAEQKEQERILKDDETYLLKKKIENLKKTNSKSKNLFNIAVVSLIIIILLSIYILSKNIREKKNAKQRLEQLLQTEKSESKDNGSSSKLVIKNEQHQEIIDGLKKIEKSLFFLKEDFNLYTTAKKIGTNTTYLSKIIKDYKKMTFSEYTNELRIKYIVEKLSTDKTVRAYTTQAIGEIGGYKNAKSFTRIFKKYTGITPFQFIEKIETEL
ncbi:Helix-turn-helix protein [Tenacibaculum sp. 190524A05c]